ncbi:MAG: BamA/TamA family outer membrane protein, partial [bacterium]
DSGVQKLLLTLSEDGYYFCRVDSVAIQWNGDSTQVDLTVHLYEGERLILKELEIAGVPLEETDQETFRLTRMGKPLFAAALQADLWELLRQQEEAGHPFARLDVKRLGLQNDSLTLAAKLISGPRATVEAVRVQGVKHTKPKVIAREARLVPGAAFSPNRIEKAKQRIKKLPFIEEISEPALVPLGEDRYDLLFNVKEARSNSFDGVIGYQPSGQGNKSQITGMINLSFLNLFGTARQARIEWQRYSETWQALELFYEEPWVAGFPVNLWGEFRQEILDTLYLTREIAGGASWRALDVLTLKGSLFQEEILPDSAGRSYLGLYRSRSLGGAVELEYDTRDVPANPTKGIYYRSYVSAAQKEYEPAANQAFLDVHKYESDLNWSQRIVGRQILNLQLYGRILESDEKPIPITDLYRLGGAQSLRGYREDQFLGSIIAWSSLEYRLWLDKLSRLYAFFSLGYYEHEPADAPKIQHYPWSYGFGFRQGTRLGIIGFDFALGENDVLATAKVHFRLINQF